MQKVFDSENFTGSVGINESPIEIQHELDELCRPR